MNGDAVMVQLRKHQRNIPFICSHDMYGMVWYGMVWYGMVWYGMVWYGMVWYGMVWYCMHACIRMITFDYVCIYGVHVFMVLNIYDIRYIHC